MCFPTHCTIIVAFVTRPPASAPVNQELVADSVTDAMRTLTILAEDVLVSVKTRSSSHEQLQLPNKKNNTSIPEIFV